MSRTYVALACLVMVACGEPATPNDSGSALDGGPLMPDSGGLCTRDVECDDGLFCTGRENCEPADPGSDADGCVAGTAPCAAGVSCNEAADACNTDCTTDADGDGALAESCGGDDCDDADASRYSGATEVCNAVDEDCDDTTFGSRDADGDLFVDALCCNGSTCGDDCDDTLAGVHPDLTESCDGDDTDCDGAIDEGVLSTLYVDADGDGYGAGAAMMLCGPLAGYSTFSDDCDDADVARHPGGTELCADTIDNDCDTRVDESGPRLFFRDADMDTYGDPGDTVMTTECTAPSGYVANSRDCSDGNAAIHPTGGVVGADPCDGLDNDCAIPLSGGLELGEDRDLDGHSPATASCTGGYPKDDCQDGAANVHGGAAELCDGLDNNCSTAGGADATEDMDGDFHAPTTAGCTGGPYVRNDCVDGNPMIYGGAPELCDRLDNDCGAGGGVAAAEDADNDGHAAPGAPCTGGPFAMDDCADVNPTIYPTAPELCDRLDNDCSSGGGVNAAEDADADSYSPPAAACTGGTLPKTDCDDAITSVHPTAPEVCNRRDDDCSSGGGVNAAEDMDGDMHSAPAAACTGGLPKDDCDDASAAVYPGAGLLAPRPYAPENGAYTGSSRAGLARMTRRPLFRWNTDAGACGATTYEVQVDDDCTTPGFASCAFPAPEIAATAIATTEHRPATNLAVAVLQPVGTRYYWRVRACEGGTCGPYSAVRYLEVGRTESDFDGDGYADIATGARGTGVTHVYVYRGGSGGAATAPSQTITDTGAYGDRLATIDANADGFADLMGHGSNANRIGLFLGGTSGLATSATVITDPGTLIIADRMAPAGDTNADGYADLVVGQAANNASYVYFGGASGITSTGFVRIGRGSGGDFGDAVAGLDVDGDGYSDVVVGAPARAPSGTVEVMLGSAGGPTSLGPTIASPMAGSARFGGSLAVADVDGDGRMDLVVVATDAPWAYVYDGTPTGLVMGSTNFYVPPGGSAVVDVGDTDGDGYDEIGVDGGGRFDLRPGSPTGLSGTASRTYFGTGGSSRCSLDVQGDGFSDLVLGYTGALRVYVYQGSLTGLPAVTISTTIVAPPLVSEFGASVADARWSQPVWEMAWWRPATRI